MMLAFHTLSVIRRSQKRNLTWLCVVYRENNWQGGQRTGTSSSVVGGVLKFCGSKEAEEMYKYTSRSCWLGGIHFTVKWKMRSYNICSCPCCENRVWNLVANICFLKNYKTLQHKVKIRAAFHLAFLFAIKYFIRQNVFLSSLYLSRNIAFQRTDGDTESWLVLEMKHS